MTGPSEASTRQYEFGSAPWVDQVRELVGRRLKGIDLSGITTSFSEEFTDPPPHLLGPEATTIGWHFRIADGKATVAAHPLPAADLRLIGDYTTVLELARLRFSDPAIGPLAEAALEAGALRYEGTSKGRDPAVSAALAALHDDLVPVTA